MNLAPAAAVLAAFLLAPAIAPAGTLERIPTRPGVRVSLFWEAAPGAKATVLLLPGGEGGFGGVTDGRPTGGNFLVRSTAHFLANGLNVAIFGRPLGSGGIAPAERLGEDHLADLRKAVEFAVARSPVPVWLVGTSRGTTSAAAAAIAMSAPPVAGVVLTASIASAGTVGSVTGMDLAAIRVPALVYHHAKDECRSTPPHEAKAIHDALVNAPVRRLVMATGGSGPYGDVCQAFHWHGFIGMEKQAVDEIAAFIAAPR